MPPRPPAPGVLFLCLCAFLHRASAQSAVVLTADGTRDSIVVTGRIGAVMDAPIAVRGYWSQPDGPEASFRFEPATELAEGLTLSLADLVVAGVEQYLDQRIHFNRNGVTTDLPTMRMAEGVDRLIATASAKFGKDPPKLSPACRTQLDRVSRIDWSKATFGVDGGDDQEKYLAIYYYVRAQRQELERLLRTDLAPLNGVDVLLEARIAETKPKAAEAEPATDDEVFDDQHYMYPLDMQPDSASAQDVALPDALARNLATRMQVAAEPKNGPHKVRKRDRWLKDELDAINERIDKLDQRKELWALRDRMDAVEGRLDDLELRVEESAKQPPAGDDLMTDPSALTGRALAVHFAVNSALVGPEDRLLLMEVAREMGRSPKDRVLITGFADPSGSAEGNLALSERRAKAVRACLIDLGIDPGRLLINFRGSAAGPGLATPGRRVEIAWLR